MGACLLLHWVSSQKSICKARFRSRYFPLRFSGHYRPNPRPEAERSPSALSVAFFSLKKVFDCDMPPYYQELMFLFFSKLLTSVVSPVMIISELLVIALMFQHRKPRLARVMEIAALLLLTVAGNGCFGAILAGRLEQQGLTGNPVPNAQAIVVLSSSVKPAVPPQPTLTIDEATANRLLYGAELYRAGKAPIVILSGGQMPWTGIPAAFPRYG